MKSFLLHDCGLSISSHLAKTVNKWQFLRFIRTISIDFGLIHLWSFLYIVIWFESNFGGCTFCAYISHFSIRFKCECKKKQKTKTQQQKKNNRKTKRTDVLLFLKNVAVLSVIVKNKKYQPLFKRWDVYKKMSQIHTIKDEIPQNSEITELYLGN